MLERTMSDNKKDLTLSGKGRKGPSRWGRAVVQGLLALVILGGAVFASARLIEARKPPPVREASEQSYAVAVIRANNEIYPVQITAYGETLARQRIDLRALVSGEIVDVHPDLQEGAFLPEGARLLTIDPFTYEGALVEAQSALQEAQARKDELQAQIDSEEAALTRAREQVALAERDLERAQALLQTRALSERQVDDRRLVLSQRQSAVEARQSALQVAKARLDQQNALLERLSWQVRQAERNLANTTLLAPFDVIVRSESVAPGRLVNTNDVVASLYNPASLQVRFTLSDDQLRMWNTLSGQEAGELIGHRLDIISSVNDDQRVWQADITRLGADIDRASGGLAVFAQIKQADSDRSFLAEEWPRPGTFVTAILQRNLPQPGVRLPETALYEAHGPQPHVFVVDNNRLQRQPVQIIARQGQTVFVSGLQDGQTVNITAFVEAGDGVLVTPLPQQPESFPAS
jgi:RND family efflux transporter MFP subunit